MIIIVGSGPSPATTFYAPGWGSGCRKKGGGMSKSSHKKLSRRKFLKSSGITALSLLLSGLPPLRGGLFAGTGDTPEAPRLKVGFIPLTDCASVVMAQELGLYKKYGLEVTVSKEASWAGVRDKLTRS